MGHCVKMKHQQENEDKDEKGEDREESRSTEGLPQVFLGGVCGKTKWRKEIAIPILEDRNIAYFNPQVEEGQWDESLIAIEQKARIESKYFLFYLCAEYSSLVSMLEILHEGNSGKTIFVVLEEYQGRGGEGEGEGYAKDVRRARSYLGEMVKDYPQIHLYSGICEAALKLCKEIEKKSE